MTADAMVFAMANPNPEVTPEEAAPYVRIIATGPLGLPEPDQQRPRLPRHLPRRARRARAADHRGDEDGRRARRSPAIVADDELREDYIIPSVFNRDVAPAVAAGGRRAGARDGRGATRDNEVGFAPADELHVGDRRAAASRATG